MELKKRNAAFDGLRGFAALYVVAFHTIFGHGEAANHSSTISSIILAGSKMVLVFFVLSGYFIVASLRQLHETSERPRLDFAIRRFFRIVPLWWLLLFWMFFYGPVRFDVLVSNAVFFFGDFKLGSRWLPVVPAWSLAAEVCFYVVAGLSSAQLISLKFRSTCWIWALAVACGIVWRYAGREHLGLDEFQIFIAPFSNLSYFAAGVALESWHRTGGRLPAWPRWQLLALEILTITFFVLESVPHLGVVPLEITAPLLVLWTGHAGGLMHRVMGTWVFRKLGRLSFGIYILQDQAAIYSRKWFTPEHLTSELVARFAVGIVFALIAYWIIERPFIRWSHLLKLSRHQ